MHTGKVDRILQIALVPAGLFAVGMIGLACYSPDTEAANLATFKAGNIMSDSVMTNKNSLTVSQIQSFLNSKVSCDTNGTKPASEYGRSDITHAQYAALRGWHGPPYTCLNNYNEGGRSAAQIIYDAGQQYGVNPQSLIVLLQKEQGLVTDTWPLNSQYRGATGYGCPDTAPCDSEYYGFVNQVNWAAKHFGYVVRGTWGSGYNVGNNDVRYNPNAACGSSNVYIENRTTQALYLYTPYQPNQAALAAGYGQGDNCSAHGNRNFYAYFTDWFGNTNSIPVKNLSSKATNILSSGDSLKPGEFLTSPDGCYILVMQYSGQLVIYRGKIEVWRSSLINWDEKDASLSVQNDGNLVVHKDGVPTWSSNTAGRGIVQLSMQNDGNLVLYQIGGSAIWSSDTARALTNATYRGARLDKLATLKANEYLRSSDWRYFLKMQTDGNLVLYTAGGTHALWSSNTAGQGPSYLINQGDGNIVIYKSTGDATWSSGTDRKGDASLVLQSDGNLVVYNTKSNAAWSSNTANKGVSKLAMQNDGNLVIYNNKGATWSSNTAGKGESKLAMQNDGNLVIYNNKGATWASYTPSFGNANGYYACSETGSTLSGGTVLQSGRTVCSGNGSYMLAMQADGNLVIYAASSSAAWSSGSNGRFFKSDLQL